MQICLTTILPTARRNWQPCDTNLIIIVSHLLLFFVRLSVAWSFSLAHLLLFVCLHSLVRSSSLDHLFFSVCLHSLVRHISHHPTVSPPVHLNNIHNSYHYVSSTIKQYPQTQTHIHTQTTFFPFIVSNRQNPYLSTYTLTHTHTHTHTYTQTTVSVHCIK